MFDDILEDWLTLSQKSCLGKRDVPGLIGSFGEPCATGRPLAAGRRYYGIRTAHQLCDKRHLNRAYRWFCVLI